jgi:hypothetical protein
MLPATRLKHRSKIGEVVAPTRLYQAPAFRSIGLPICRASTLLNLLCSSAADPGKGKALTLVKASGIIVLGVNNDRE